MHKKSVVEHTAAIVIAYVANNPVPAAALPDLLFGVHAALAVYAPNPAPPVEVPSIAEQVTE